MHKADGIVPAPTADHFHCLICGTDKKLAKQGHSAITMHIGSKGHRDTKTEALVRLKERLLLMLEENAGVLGWEELTPVRETPLNTVLWERPPARS